MPRLSRIEELGGYKKPLPKVEWDLPDDYGRKKSPKRLGHWEKKKLDEKLKRIGISPEEMNSKDFVLGFRKIDLSVEDEETDKKNRPRNQK